VVVVATVIEERRVGCTATAWGEAPEPPLLLTTLRAGGRTGEAIRTTGVFSVSVLARDQRRAAVEFALPEPDRFRALADRMSTGHLGLPVLDGAAAVLFCELEDTHPFGSQEIYVGRIVRSTGQADATPLLFASGRFAEPRWKDGPCAD
jgi:flavin reductase (DIM6/NTAB) family NADH-FMN oxidoreductase RutF